MRPWKRLELEYMIFICLFIHSLWFFILCQVSCYVLRIQEKSFSSIGSPFFGEIGKENECNNKQCNKPYTRSMDRVLSELRGQCNFAHRRLGIDPRGSSHWTETWRIEVHQDDRLGLREEDMPGKRHSKSNGIKVRKQVFCWENLLIFKRTKGMMNYARWWWTKRQRVEHCTLLPASDHILSALTYACTCWLLLLPAPATQCFPWSRSMFSWCTEWTSMMMVALGSLPIYSLHSFFHYANSFLLKAPMICLRSFSQCSSMSD